jgi:hypothetical protein
VIKDRTEEPGGGLGEFDPTEEPPSDEKKPEKKKTLDPKLAGKSQEEIAQYYADQLMKVTNPFIYRLPLSILKKIPKFTGRRSRS